MLLSDIQLNLSLLIKTEIDTLIAQNINYYFTWHTVIFNVSTIVLTTETKAKQLITDHYLQIKATVITIYQI